MRDRRGKLGYNEGVRGSADVSEVWLGRSDSRTPPRVGAMAEDVVCFKLRSEGSAVFSNNGCMESRGVRRSEGVLGREGSRDLVVSSMFFARLTLLRLGYPLQQQWGS
jgi:hypothetical protein